MVNGRGKGGRKDGTKRRKWRGKWERKKGKGNGGGKLDINGGEKWGREKRDVSYLLSLFCCILSSVSHLLSFIFCSHFLSLIFCLSSFVIDLIKI